MMFKGQVYSQALRFRAGGGLRADAGGLRWWRRRDCRKRRIRLRRCRRLTSRRLRQSPQLKRRKRHRRPTMRWTRPAISGAESQKLQMGA